MRGGWGPGLGASLLVAGILSCGDPADPPIDPTEQVAALESVAGSDQQAEVGTTLDSALVVRAVDANGDPVAGATISWSVSAGRIEPESSTADTAGEARAEWRMGEVAGTDTAIAAVGDAQVELFAIARPGAAANLTVDPSELLLDALGARERLQAIAHDRYGNLVSEGLEWVSSDSSVARVDAEGWVAAVANGRARVIVRAGEAVDTAVVVVEQVASELRVQPAGVVLEGVGATHRLAAQAVDRLGAPVGSGLAAEWSVSNTAVAQIDSDDSGGRVTALRGGQVAVTARVDQREGRAVVTVREPSARARHEWRLASAQTNSTLAVGGTAAGDVWLVPRTSRGFAKILHYDGGALQPAGPAVPGVELSALWVFGSESIVVGSVPTWTGRAFRYDGASWQPMQLPSSAGSLLDVWGSAPDDVWAVSNLSQILHYDGDQWRIVVDHPPDDIQVGPAAIWGAGPEEVFVLLSPNRVLHHDGGPPSHWTEIGPEQEGIYRSLWGSSPDDVYLVGSGALQFDGEGWSTVAALDGVEGRFEVVGGSGPEDVYVGGGGVHGLPELLFHFDGASWQEVERAASEKYGLVDSWTAPTGEVYLSGHRGLFVRAESGELSEIHHADTPSLHDVWGASESNVFAVGSAGTILHHDGDGWNTVESGTDRELFTIWGTGPEAVFAGGADGTVLHFDGAWGQLPAAGTGDVFAVWGLAEDDLFAAVADPHDERGRILHFDGTDWTPSPVVAPEDKDISFSTDIRAFWGFAPDDVLAAGQVWWRDCEGCVYQLRDAVLRWDGEAWSTVWTGTSHDNHFADIWASSPTDIWVIGRYGSNPYAVRYDGSQWSEVGPQVPAYTYPPLTAVWGTGPEDVYLGGLDGLLLHFDGADWTELKAQVEETVGGIWGTATGPAWAVTGARFLPTGGGILRGIRD